MSDLINRNDIYKLFENGIAKLHVSDIDVIPTVDAVEVVHGHKIIRNRPYTAQYIYVGDDGYGNLVKRTDCSGTPIEISPATLSNPIEYCSECGKRMDGIWQNFCDNCGAKMDEVVGT